MVAPAGEQFEITGGGYRAVVVEGGGALRRLDFEGRPLVDGFAVDAMPSGGRGQVLVPWPNRIRDGRYTWDGAEHQLPLNEPEVANAIHGLVRFVPWSVVERSSDSIVLGYLLYPQPGYPFALRLQVGYALSADGLRVTTTATNEGDADLPYGEGHHPYLASPGGRLDDDVLTVPAATRIVPDERLLPVGTEPVEGTPYDLRTGRRIGDLRLDDCVTDLARDAEGIAEVRLVDAAGRGAAVWMDASYRYLQLFTGDVVEPASRRRRGLAVEPMTCPPDALNSGEAVRRLAPGESTTSTWGIRPL